MFYYFSVSKSKSNKASLDSRSPLGVKQERKKNRPGIQQDMKLIIPKLIVPGKYRYKYTHETWIESLEEFLLKCVGTTRPSRGHKTGWVQLILIMFG